jgi:hypothetical protein
VWGIGIEKIHTYTGISYADSIPVSRLPTLLKANCKLRFWLASNGRSIRCWWGWPYAWDRGAQFADISTVNRHVQIRPSALQCREVLYLIIFIHEWGVQRDLGFAYLGIDSPMSTARHVLIYSRVFLKTTWRSMTCRLLMGQSQLCTCTVSFL